MSPWAAPSSLARDTQAERVETGKGRLTGHQAAQRRADHEAGRMGQYGAGELPFDGFEQIWQSLSERIWTGVIHLAQWCVRGPLVRASETADLFCLIAEETVSHRLWSPGLPACTGSPRNTTPRHAPCTTRSPTGHPLSSTSGDIARPHTARSASRRGARFTSSTRRF